MATSGVKTASLPKRTRMGVIPEPHKVEFREITLPALGPGEALVRQRATAICSWEYRTYSGTQSNRFPFIGGHETAGEVIAVGESCGALKVGDRVAIGPTPCGACHWCRTGADEACEQSAPVVTYDDMWGPAGFAEYRVHPAKGLYSIGDAPYELGCLTEPLSCALHGVRMLGVTVGQDAVVIGAGVMGLMNVIALKLHGARVIVTEVDPARLALARQMGADETVDATHEDPMEAVKRLTGGRGAEHVILAIGGPKATRQGWNMVSRRGRLLLFAAAHPDVEIVSSASELHGHETGLVGTIRMDTVDFYAASRLIALGQVDLRPLVADSYALDDLKAALDAASVPNTYRTIVTSGPKQIE